VTGRPTGRWKASGGSSELCSSNSGSFRLGLVFVRLALVALRKVAEQDAGVASSLLNTARQVGGAIGLALLGTVAWTTVAESVRTQVAAAAKAGQPVPKPGTAPPVSIYYHALTVGLSAPRQNRNRRHHSPRHRRPRQRSPALYSGMRTGPLSPRPFVPVGSAGPAQAEGTTPKPWL
jgi:hypothetical protein